MIKIKFRDETKANFLYAIIFSIAILWAWTGYCALMRFTLLIDRELNWQIFSVISIAGLISLTIIYLPQIIHDKVLDFKRWKSEHYKDGVLEI